MKARYRKPDLHVRHAIRRYRQWQQYEAFREHLRLAGEAFRHAIALITGR